MRKTPKKFLALALAGTLTLAACGDDDSPSSSGDPTIVDEGTDAGNGDDGAMEEGDHNMAADTDTGASQLRSGLTSLLQEHVYLAGIAVETALDAGGDLEDPSFQAAAAALDENSVALSEAITSVAGADNGEAFLGLWREHIGFFVDYTLGKATNDPAKADQALADLAGYQQAAGAFFEEITGGELPADALVANLDMHISTLSAAIDSLVSGEGDPFALLQDAADHMDSSALALSSAIVAALPDTFDGETTSAPAETRAVLTSLLQEHVYLAGIAIEQAVEVGGDMQAPAVQAAVATLDGNSVELSEVIRSVAGDENADAFLGLWREHIGFFVDYTLGGATGDAAAQEQALADLAGYQEAAGAFFEEITAGELPADALIANLDSHISTLTATIDSLLAGDGQVFDLLRDAGQHMPSSAAAISAAVVKATS